MEKSNRRRVAIILVVLLILIALLLVRCNRPKPTAPEPVAAPKSTASSSTAQSAATTPAGQEPAEILTPATIKAAPHVGAGTAFSVAWNGPNNATDYITIVRKESSDKTSGEYALTRSGSPLQLTAPIEPGTWELRYVAARSHTILGRADLIVTPAGARLEAAAETALDTPLSVAWTGPNNAGDYITLVAKDATDGKYGDYTLTAKGSPLTVTAPAVAGEGELRYMTGQGGKVLARRAVKITAPEVSLSAPAEGIAGASISVTWKGPANSGDYITVVERTAADGQYKNYTDVNKGSPLKLMLLIDAGDAELRYMTGRGAKVLARRPIKITAAEISLSAPNAAAVGSAISITWTGPANDGDYLTVVTKTTPDGQYGNYTGTNKGSPLSVNAPKTAGPAEVRYMSGQGSKVLARRPITITP